MLFPQNDLQLHVHLADLMIITELEIQQHSLLYKSITCFE